MTDLQTRWSLNPWNHFSLEANLLQSNNVGRLVNCKQGVAQSNVKID